MIIFALFQRMNRKLIILILLGFLSILTWDSALSENKISQKIPCHELNITEEMSDIQIMPDYISSYSSSDSAVRTTRTTSCSVPSRILSKSKRQTQNHKFNVTILKGGKSLSTSTFSIIRPEFRSSFGYSEITQHLTSLGKLIIQTFPYFNQEATFSKENAALPYYTYIYL